MRNRPTDADIAAAEARSMYRTVIVEDLRRRGFTFGTQWLLSKLSGYKPTGQNKRTTARVSTPAIPPACVPSYDPDDGVYRTLGAPSGWQPFATEAADVVEVRPSASDIDIAEIELDDLVPGGVITSAEKDREHLAPGRYVFTSAQSNTKVHAGFFNALLGYCQHIEAELHVSTFTYNKSGHSDRSIKPGSKKSTDNDDVWFDHPVVAYISDVSLQVAPDLVFCGELNVLPTRINPLSSFTSYARQNSAIIPHAKIAMQSIPTMKHDAARFLYSTGAVTQRNYIQKTAGQLADFHHVFGALVVEVAEDGQWWARQLNADDTGAFQDLTTLYLPDGTNATSGTLAINHGDIHWNKRDDDILGCMFYKDGVLDTLKPENQFFHDLVDFQARNHHNIKDPHFMHQMQVDGSDSVEREFDEVGAFLVTIGYREWCNTYIVESNHDTAIELWLKNIAGAADPTNVRVWHKWNYEAYKQREDGTIRGLKPFERAMRDAVNKVYADCPGLRMTQNPLVILNEDDSLWLCGIQFGLHGHLGPNGARGAPKNLRSVGKANTGHTHSAGIVDGVYTAGVFGKLDMGYNKGLSSWSNSFILTYPNGKRTIVTIKNGKAWL